MFHGCVMPRGATSSIYHPHLHAHSHHDHHPHPQACRRTEPGQRAGRHTGLAAPRPPEAAQPLHIFPALSSCASTSCLAGGLSQSPSCLLLPAQQPRRPGSPPKLPAHRAAAPHPPAASAAGPSGPPPAPFGVSITCSLHAALPPYQRSPQASAAAPQPALRWGTARTAHCPAVWQGGGLGRLQRLRRLLRTARRPVCAHLSRDDEHKGAAAVAGNVRGGLPEELHKLAEVARVERAVVAAAQHPRQRGGAQSLLWRLRRRGRRCRSCRCRRRPRPGGGAARAGAAPRAAGQLRVRAAAGWGGPQPAFGAPAAPSPQAPRAC